MTAALISSEVWGAAGEEPKRDDIVLWWDWVRLVGVELEVIKVGVRQDLRVVYGGF
jgi:hypothetical protein